MNIQMKQIVESKDNPRTIFDDEKMKELVLSIKKEGVKDPITCRRISGDNNNPGYEIVYGHRRYRAAKQLKLVEIPCYLVTMTDKEAEAARIREAVLHERLSPLEEAKAFEKYADDQKNVSNKEIGLQFGKSAHYIAQRRHLSKLLPEWKALLEKGTVSIGACMEIAKLFPEQQKEFLAFSKTNHNLHSEEYMLRTLNDQFILNLSSAPFKKDDATLIPKAGTCIVCQKRSGANLDLFVNNKKNDLCLDQACFRAKLKMFFEIKQKEYEDDGKKLLLITDDYHSSGEILGTALYSEVPLKEAKMFGIFVDGDEIGKIKGVILNKTDASTSSGEKNEPTFARRMELYKRRMEIFNNRIEQEVRRRLVMQILPAIKKVTKEDLSIISEWVDDKVSNSDENFLCEALGVKEIKIDAMHEHQLMRVLLGQILISEEMINDPTMRAYAPERMNVLTKIYGISRVDIAKQVSTEFKPKEPKKPLKEPTAVKSESKKKPAAKTKKKG